MSPKNSSNAKIKKHYNLGYFEQVYKAVGDEELYIIYSKAAKKKYFRNINYKNKKILEYGCGTGKNIYGLKNAEGYDISDDAINICRNKGIKTVKKPKKNFYDIVLLSQCLEHLPLPAKTLEEIRGYLKKEGLLIISLPQEKHRLITHYKKDIDNHLYSWNFNGIKNLLIFCGYDVLRMEWIRDGMAFSKLRKCYLMNFELTYSILRFIARILRFHKKAMLIVATPKKNINY